MIHVIFQEHRHITVEPLRYDEVPRDRESVRYIGALFHHFTVTLAVIKPEYRSFICSWSFVIKGLVVLKNVRYYRNFL